MDEYREEERAGKVPQLCYIARAWNVSGCPVSPAKNGAICLVGRKM